MSTNAKDTEDRSDEVPADVVDIMVIPFRRSKRSKTAPHGRRQLFVRLLLKDDHGRLYRLNSSAWGLEPMTAEEAGEDKEPDADTEESKGGPARGR